MRDTYTSSRSAARPEPTNVTSKRGSIGEEGAWVGQPDVRLTW
jgi:hypothetical protein